VTRSSCGTFGRRAAAQIGRNGSVVASHADIGNTPTTGLIIQDEPIAVKRERGLWDQLGELLRAADRAPTSETTIH
jgi:hypothetical protein